MTIYADRVQEISTTGGSGTLTLAGAVLGFQAFSTAFPVLTALVPYTITDSSGNWETGHGTYDPAGPTLTRSVVSSSNTGALVTFPGATAVFNTLLAEDFNTVATLAAGGSSGINLQTASGAYTAVLADASVNEVQFNNAALNSLVIPLNATVAFPVGAQIGVRMLGAGQTSVSPFSGVTLTSIKSLNLLKQGALAVAIQVATDVWELTGELKPTATYKSQQTYEPANSTTAGTLLGLVISSTATVSHPTQALTNLLTALHRTLWSTTTTAGNASGFYETVATKVQGNAAGLGGYCCDFRFGIAVNTTGHQCFVGLGAAAALAGDPSALVSMIGMGYDAADLSTGNWQLMHNDSAGTATRVDLGSGAVRNTSDVYKLTLYAPSDGSAIFVTVVNEASGVTVLSTSYSTDIPATNLFLSARVQCRNGAIASSMQVALAHYDAGMQE